MKPIALIFLIVAGVAGTVALSLYLSNVRLNPINPLVAGLIAAVAATLSMLPMIRSRSKDAVTIVQLALVATVLHLLASAVLTFAAFGVHLVTIHGPFVYWILGAYWVSLVVLVWQLRLIILQRTSASPTVSTAVGPVPGANQGAN